MNEHNTHEKSWCQRNKKKIAMIAGIIFVASIGFIVIKNNDTIMTLSNNQKIDAVKANQLFDKPVVDSTQRLLKTTPVNNPVTKSIMNNGQPFIVHQFTRNLPNGQHPSPHKIAQAAALGISIGEHQTIVDSHIKNAA